MKHVEGGVKRVNVLGMCNKNQCTSGVRNTNVYSVNSEIASFKTHKGLSLFPCDGM